MNRFIKWVNQFKQQKDNLKVHEEWNNSMYWWIDSSEPRMKNDMIHTSNESIQGLSESFVRRFKEKWVDSCLIRFRRILNRFINSQRLWWIDSVYSESIQQAEGWNRDLWTYSRPRHWDAGCFNMIIHQVINERYTVLNNNMKNMTTEFLAIKDWGIKGIFVIIHL